MALGVFAALVNLPVREARDRAAGAAAGMKPPAPRWLRSGRCGLAVVLALVFAAYLSPHLVVDLANRVWACF